MNIEKQFPIGTRVEFKISMTENQKEYFNKKGFTSTDVSRVSGSSFTYGDVIDYDGEYVILESGFGNIDKVHYSDCILSEEDKKKINRDNNIDDILS